LDLKLGYIVYKRPVEDCFEYAAKHGMSHLEIDLTKDHDFIRAFTFRRISLINKLAERHGITLSFHVSYTINLADRFPIIRILNVRYVKKCIALAHSLRMTHVTLHIGSFFGFPVWPGMRLQALRRLVLSLRKILQYCEKYNIKLALENVTPLPAGTELVMLGDNIKDFDYLFYKLNSDNLRFCLDMGHANTSEGVLAYINKFSDKIINVHYHDNMGRTDEHLSIGEGTLPWDRGVEALKKINFRGPYISECFKSTPHESTRQFMELFEK